MPHIIGTEVQSLPEEEQIKRRGRLPKKFQDIKKYPGPELAFKVRTALERTLMKASANPRLVAPQFFRDKNAAEGEIQLLLPMNLDSSDWNNADCAVVLKRTQELGVEVYKAVSLLSLLWARRNARVIFPIEHEWLG